MNRKQFWAVMALLLAFNSWVLMAAAPRHGTDGYQRLNGTKPAYTEFDLTGGRVAAIYLKGNATNATVTLQELIDRDSGLWMDREYAYCSSNGSGCVGTKSYTPPVFNRHRLIVKSNADQGNGTVGTEPGDEVLLDGKVVQ